jgi:porin
MVRPAVLVLAGLALLFGSVPARAETAAAEATAPAITTNVSYTADVTGAVAGPEQAGRYLDNIDAIADADLARIGWDGATLHAYVLNNSGGAPNHVAGTLQGVDNIEVAVPRLRVFELWLQQDLPHDRGSLKAGLYNLNSEFYATEAAVQFLAPAFGIGSELAATGPNGPSIFPSTALGARIDLKLGGGAYVRAAVLNAKAGVMGDPRGVDFTFSDGVLMIGQAGLEGPFRVAVGAWRYSKSQAGVADPEGAPRHAAQGVYLTAEKRIAGQEGGRSVTAFVRAGGSDGETTPFKGGWQAGLHFDRPIASRPDSVASIGVEQGLLAAPFRDKLRGDGIDPAGSELGIEATYTDRLSSRVSIQPDLQWIHHAGGDRVTPDRWVLALRFRVALYGGSK